ncbi:MAG: hypothetical protein JO352_20440 [Chloroflexi bacterium]|nr:hypothetical protein [Chloroflexota bacterium]MBV9599554.1 hypothetical protein [Chloroflexota bacterium]
MQLVHKPRTISGWSRFYLRVFRTVVVASCVAFAASGWIAHIQWLVAAGVTIGLGEFVECTFYLMVLNWGERSRRIDI